MRSFATASVWARLPISSAEMLQAFEVTLDQRFFFTTAPALDLPLALESVSFRLKGLGIDQAYRTVLEGVCSASAVIVGFQTGLKIVSRSNVKTAVGAAKDVDVMHHSRQGDARLVNFYWLVMSSALTLRLCSGSRASRNLRLGPASRLLPAVVLEAPFDLRIRVPCHEQAGIFPRVEWWRRGESNPRPKVFHQK